MTVIVLVGYNYLQNFKQPVRNKIMSYNTDSIAGCLPNPLSNSCKGPTQNRSAGHDKTQF